MERTPQWGNPSSGAEGNVPSPHLDEAWLRLLFHGKARIAYENGLTEEKLRATMDFESSPHFDERERAALRFATLFKQSDDAIDSDDVYIELKKHFSEEEIIELALLCAETDGVGKFARSLRMRTWEEACSIQPLLRSKMAAVVV